MNRTRSEYRLRSLGDLPARRELDARRPVDADRTVLAELMLDAYRDTIDDEGEDLDDALAAIDHYLAIIHREQSLVVEHDGAPVAACFVLSVDDTLYIDPVIVAKRHQRSGLGGRLVLAVLHGLASGNTEEPTQVGATITDGNEPSERLFARLGFERVGAWPPTEPPSDG